MPFETLKGCPKCMRIQFYIIYDDKTRHYRYQCITCLNIYANSELSNRSTKNGDYVYEI